MTPLLPLALLAALAQDPDSARVRWFDPAPDLDRQILEAFQDLVEEDTPEHRREAARWTDQRDRVVRTFHHPLRGLDTGEPEVLFHVGAEHGARWVVSSAEETIVWDARNGRAAVRGLPGWAATIEFSADGSRLLLGTDEKGPVVLSLPGGEILHQSPPDLESRCSALDPTGRFLAQVRVTERRSPGRCDLSVIDLDESREILQVELPTWEVDAVRFSPNGRWLATSGNGAFLVERREGSAVRTLVAPAPDGLVGAVAFHGTRPLLAIAEEGWLRTFDLNSGTERSRLLTYDCGLRLAHDPVADRWVWASDRDWLLVGTTTGRASRYGETEWDALAYERTKYGLHWNLSADGHVWGTPGNGDGFLTWDTRTGRRHDPPYAQGGLVQTLSFASGERVVVGSENGIVRLWRVADGRGEDADRWTRHLEGSDFWPAPGRDRGLWIRSGTQLVVESPDGISRILADPEEELVRIAADVEGRHLVAEGVSERLWTWDLSRVDAPPRWCGAAGTLSGPALAPGGRRLAHHTLFGTNVIDLDTGQALHVLAGHSEHALRWSAAGDLLRTWYDTGEFWRPGEERRLTDTVEADTDLIPAWDGSCFLHVRGETGLELQLRWQVPGSSCVEVPLPPEVRRVGPVAQLETGRDALLVCGELGAVLLARDTGSVRARFGAAADPGSVDAAWGNHGHGWCAQGERIAHWWHEEREPSGFGSHWELLSSRDGQRLASGHCSGEILSAVPLGSDGEVALLVHDRYAEVLEVPSGMRIGDPIPLGGWKVTVEHGPGPVARIQEFGQPVWDVDLRTGEAVPAAPTDSESDALELAGDEALEEVAVPWTVSPFPPVNGCTVRWDGPRVQVLDAEGIVVLDHRHPRPILMAGLQRGGPWLSVRDTGDAVSVVDIHDRQVLLSLEGLEESRLLEDGRWLFGVLDGSYPWRHTRGWIVDLAPDPEQDSPPLRFPFEHLGQDRTEVEVSPGAIRISTVVPPHDQSWPVRLRTEGRQGLAQHLLEHGHSVLVPLDRGDHLEFEVWPRPLHDLEPVVGDPEALLESWALRLGREWVDGEWVPRR